MNEFSLSLRGVNAIVAQGCATTSKAKKVGYSVALIAMVPLALIESAFAGLAMLGSLLAKPFSNKPFEFAKQWTLMSLVAATMPFSGIIVMFTAKQSCDNQQGLEAIEPMTQNG